MFSIYNARRHDIIRLPLCYLFYLTMYTMWYIIQPTHAVRMILLKIEFIKNQKRRFSLPIIVYHWRKPFRVYIQAGCDTIIYYHKPNKSFGSEAIVYILQTYSKLSVV